MHFAGLQLLGVLVTQGMPAYDRRHDLDFSEFKFFETLLDSMNSPVKEICEATAEVLIWVDIFHNIRYAESRYEITWN